MKQSSLSKVLSQSLMGSFGIGMALSLLVPSAKAVTTVNKGTDYLITRQGGAVYTFNDPLFGPNPVTISFKGLPIVYPEPVGPTDSGRADTIVNRRDTVNADASGQSTIIEIVGLSLQNDSPVIINGVNHDVFVGLQKYYPGIGTESTGSMLIRDNGTPVGRTWDSAFNIHGVAIAAPVGVLPAITSNYVNTLISGCPSSVYQCYLIDKGPFLEFDEPWSPTPSIGQLQGPNLVDPLLDQNFYLTRPAYHDAGGGTIHIVDPVPVPLPILGVSASLAFARRLKRASSVQKRMSLSK